MTTRFINFPILEYNNQISRRQYETHKHLMYFLQAAERQQDYIVFELAYLHVHPLKKHMQFVILHSLAYHISILIVKTSGKHTC